MNNREKGTNYEKFVQGIFQTLHDAEGFEDVRVEQNKTDLIGRSGCVHQIDVYWEFKVAGQMYRTAIECKAFDEPVSIGRVRDFFGVLADIPGLQGIQVSPFGFQSGAKRYADHYGITLKEIRPPTDEDWEGRIKDIQLTFFIVSPNVTAIQPNVTEEFRTSLGEDERVEMVFEGMTDETLIVDGNGDHVASYNDMLKQLPLGKEAAYDQTHTVQYTGCFWQGTNDRRIPINGVEFRYDVLVENETIQTLGERAAKAIMKEVMTGEILFFDSNGGVRSVQ